MNAIRGVLRALPAQLADSALLLEGFVAINLAFLTIDIYVAHSMNEFRHWAEWIPFYFSIAGALIVLGIVAYAAHLGFHIPRRPGRDRDDGVQAISAAISEGTGRWAGLIVGWGSIVVGIAGLIWHLQSHFFRDATLKNLVYSAPFIAPLAYTGVGLLLLTNRVLPHRSGEWARWVLFLAWGGWLGNFGLSLLDHAQNGFYYWTEWIPVATSALAVGFIFTLTIAKPDQRLMKVSALVLALQVITGIVGLGLHLRPLLDFSTTPLFDRIVHGAPVFAPLLFVNLALLAGVGLWELWRRDEIGVTIQTEMAPLDPDPATLPAMR